MPGSVIAIAVTSSPDAMPGIHRAFCSSVQYARKYGTQMSLWRLIPRPAPPTPAIWISSSMTWLYRKSSVPPPPYSSGRFIPTKPCRPASTNTSWGTIPAASHSR